MAAVSGAKDKLIKVTPNEELARLQVRKKVRQTRCEVARPEDRAGLLAKLFPTLSKSGSACLVFCGTKNQADTISQHVGDLKALEEAGLTVGVLTGSNTPQERDAAFAKFKSGETKIMFATDALVRGVNIPKIGFVVHYDLPVISGGVPDTTTYVHRCGRCARFTGKGVSLAFDVKSNPDKTTKLLNGLELQFQTDAAKHNEDAVGEIIEVLDPKKFDQDIDAELKNM